jgi:hypothetical protein
LERFLALTKMDATDTNTLAYYDVEFVTAEGSFTAGVAGIKFSTFCQHSVIATYKEKKKKKFL